MKKILKAAGLILVLLLIYFTAQVVVSSGLGVIKLVRISLEAGMSGVTPDDSAIAEELTAFIGTQVPWIILVSAALSVPTYYLFYRNRKQELLAFVSLRSIGVLSIPVLVVFGLSLNFVIEFVLALLREIDSMAPVFKNYNDVSNMIFGGGFAANLIAIGVVGPIFEEILFRGLVFGELRKIAKVRLAIVIQALLFGAYHLNVIQGAYAFVIGLLLGFIYYRSNSIIAPILVHITINTSSVLLTEMMKSDMPDGLAASVFAAGFILFAATGAFILTSRSFKRSMDNSLYEMNRLPRLQAGGNDR